MARAKRSSSERAAARRRYRAAIEAGELDAEGLEGGEDAAPAGAGERRPNQPARSAPGGRMGFGAALRSSYHPVRLREDLAALPSLITHRALWLPVLITIATAVATGATGGTDILTGLLFTYFIVTPAIGGAFLAGFLAPRASWLLGIVVAVIAGACYITMGALGRLPGEFNTVYQTSPSAAIFSSLIGAPLFGALFASAAAWYRRFLSLTSPSRGAQQPQKRSGDGKTRGSAAQKPNAKAPARR